MKTKQYHCVEKDETQTNVCMPANQILKQAYRREDNFLFNFTPKLC